MDTSFRKSILIGAIHGPFFFFAMEVETLRQQLVQARTSAEVAPDKMPYFVDAPERSVELLEGVSRSLEADELMILDVIPGPLDLRLEMSELLADVSGLVPRVSAT
jgi:hypothetical protein